MSQKHAGLTRFAPSLALAFALLAPATARADQEYTYMQVNAYVQSPVQVVTSGVNFGTFMKPNEATGTGTVYVTSQPDQAYQILLGWGGSFDGATRHMRSMMQPGAMSLAYNLYVDPAWTQVWGDGSFGSTVSDVGDGTQRPYTVYGRVPAGQQVPGGDYSDNLQVTVLF